MRHSAFIAGFLSLLLALPAGGVEKTQPRDRNAPNARPAATAKGGPAAAQDQPPSRRNKAGRSEAKSTRNGAAKKQPARQSAATDSRNDGVKHRLRAWAGEFAPNATGHLNELHGLIVPKPLAVDRPLAVMVHGLDSGRTCFNDLAELLGDHGYQVAYLNYPNDQAITESGRLLSHELRELRADYPQLMVDVITHSMGGLVARWYIESPDYKGGIRKLILLAPPNQGAAWARCSVFSEGYEQYVLWKREPQWHWTWAITDGLGEAGRDLRPGSDFLGELNARPRQKDVEYTIIYGNRSCGWRHTANALECSADWLPDWSWTAWIGKRLRRGANSLRCRPGDSDGLVTLQSAQLEGVRDMVLVGADHTTICCSRNGKAPVAWKAISKRLSLARN